MAKKKDICLSCKKYDFENQVCNEEKLKEIVIINRKEHINNYRPYKLTECNYFEDLYNATADGDNP